MLRPKCTNSDPNAAAMRQVMYRYCDWLASLSPYVRAELRELEGEMQEAAANLEYERAALLRDQIRELRKETGIETGIVEGKAAMRAGRIPRKMMRAMTMTKA